MRAIDPPAAKPLEDRAQAFAPLLVVNQVRTPEHRDVGPRIVASCRDRLGVAIELAGSIDSDPNVAASVERRQPALQAFPLSRFSRQIEALAKRLQRGDADASREREEESGDRASRVAASRPWHAAPRARGNLRRRRAVPPAASARSGRARLPTCAGVVRRWA